MINIIIGAGASVLVILFAVRKIVRYKRNIDAVKRGDQILPSRCAGCSGCSDCASTGCSLT